jgi:hypothetical protein
MLINILTRGQSRHSVAWIVTDTMTSAGFRLHYDQVPAAIEKPVGGNPAPRAATDGRTVIEDKKGEVARYLAESFGLTAEQAERVVAEAHEWHSPRSTGKLP